MEAQGINNHHANNTVLKRTGFTVLPLHGGHAPRWLIERMTKLADEIVWLMVDDYGTHEFLRRVSNPYWLQALGCALGFDWHSSGLTTVVTGVLKQALSHGEQGIRMAGGKGRASRMAQSEIDKIGEEFSLSSHKVEELKYASRMCAKVDNAAIQADYPIYHHAFFFDEKGGWAVVQQGMCVEDSTARRYHWLSEGLEAFIVEPHEAIVGDVKRERVLNMTAREAEENRELCTDLVKEDPHNLISSIRRLGSPYSLDSWTSGASPIRLEGFSMPKNLNWEVFKMLYDHQPRNYEELLAFRGVGPSLVRALALISEIVYGKPTSWKDPVKYSFAFGGKDGVPRPINRAEMDRVVQFLRGVVEGAEVDKREKVRALKRLRSFVL